MKFIIFTSRTRLFRWPASSSVSIGSRKGSYIGRIVSHIRHIRNLIVSIGGIWIIIESYCIFIFIIIDNTDNIFIGVIICRPFKYYFIRCSSYSSERSIIWEGSTCSIECAIIKRHSIVVGIYFIEHISQWFIISNFTIGNPLISHQNFSSREIVGRTIQYKITIQIEIIICFTIIIIILIEIHFSDIRTWVYIRHAFYGKDIIYPVSISKTS